MKLNVIHFLFLITCVFSYECFACVIKAPNKIVITAPSHHASIKNVITFEKCSSDLENRFVKNILDYSGVLQPRAVKLAYDAFIEHEIAIYTLEDYLSKNLKPGESLYIKEAKVVGQARSIFSLNEFDDISIDCNDCKNIGTHSAKIVHTNSKGQATSFWTSFKVQKKIDVLTARSSQSVDHKELQPHLFTWQTIYTEKPEAYFVEKNQLQYYKANQKLREGDALLKTHLTPVNLIKMGDMANIEMKLGNITLKGKGMATRSGKIGDVISLKNLRTQKVIMGKVIGKNTIEAQL